MDLQRRRRHVIKAFLDQALGMLLNRLKESKDIEVPYEVHQSTPMYLGESPPSWTKKRQKTLQHVCIN